MICRQYCHSSSGTALIEGNNSLGAVVGNYAMEVAISKAKETGVGWVFLDALTSLKSILFTE